MKKYVLLFLATLSLTSCFENDVRDNNLIPEIFFTASKDLNLPESSALLVPNGFAIYPELGHRGIIVYRRDETNFLAFDLAVPHVSILECSSPMDISNFPELKNSCTEDGIYYNFSVGYSTTYMKDGEGKNIKIPEGQLVYDMQEYNVVLVGENVLQIRNF